MTLPFLTSSLIFVRRLLPWQFFANFSLIRENFLFVHLYEQGYLFLVLLFLFFAFSLIAANLLAWLLEAIINISCYFYERKKPV